MMPLPDSDVANYESSTDWEPESGIWVTVIAMLIIGFSGGFIATHLIIAISRGWLP